MKRLVSDIEGSLSKPSSATRRDPTRAWVRPRGIPSFRALCTDQGRSAPGEEVGTLRSAANENARRASSPEKRGDHTLRLLAKKQLDSSSDESSLRSSALLSSHRQSRVHR